MSAQSPVCSHTINHPQEADKPCHQADDKWILIATITASSMAFIAGTIVNIALPSIQQALDIGFSSAQWIINSFALFLGACILIGGSLGDHLGKRKMFVMGIVIYGVASTGCALSTGINSLIVFRAVQGLGAALLIPQSLAIIASNIPKERRGRAISLWAAASALTSALGPVLGGWLIDSFGWQAAFWFNVPFAVFAVVISLYKVPDDQASQSGRIDWSGAVLAIAGFAVLSLAMTLYAELNNVYWLLGLLISGALIVYGFILRQMHAAEPMLDLSLFKNSLFSGTNLLTLILYAALAAVLYLLPYELIQRRGLSSTQAGMVMLPFGLVMGVLSRFAGSWADKHNPVLALVIGTAIVTAAIIGFSLQRTDLTSGIMLPLIVMSVGMACVVSPLTTIVMNSVDDDQNGAASGVNNSASRLAGLFGVALTGSIGAVVYQNQPGINDSMEFGELPEPDSNVFETAAAAFDLAYQVSMSLTAGICFIAFLISVWLYRKYPH